MSFVDPRRTYAIVARSWACAFALVGLLFLAAPGATGAIVTWLGRKMGLSGTMTSSGGDLWWVLAVSLMASITALAEVSARAPESDGPYVTLMVAKLTSTALFSGLAVSHGTIWWLCAGTDGFVALTLWLARRRLAPAAAARACPGEA
jgi:hypothetical protein